MFFVSEKVVQDLVTQLEITKVIEDVYVAMAENTAVNFPVVRESLGYANAVFGFKSGFRQNEPLLGVKAGGFWPGNSEKSLPNHQSTILLFDPDTGGPSSLICGTYLTALRTAAASAVSIKHLAREDAEVLGVIGAGGQAIHQIRAAMEQRSFAKIVISAQSEMGAIPLIKQLEKENINAEYQSPKMLAQMSDVIITVTPSRKAILDAQWVKPGTHIACIGADTKGKQEVDMRVLSRALLFADELNQAISIGECQHAYASQKISKSDITAIGKVINGQHRGRIHTDDITLFDSTGVGLQDLVASQLALELAITHNRVIELDTQGKCNG